MGQNYRFLFYAKNHYDIKIMFHKDIFYRNFWLVICIAKNLIWTDFLNI